MQLSNKAIEEFQEIWLKEFGEKISKDRAREEGNKLIELFRIIYRPILKERKSNPKNH